MSDRQAVLDVLRSGERFLLTVHVRPDGDSVGSTLALYHGLRALGKEAVMMKIDDPPENLSFLPGIGEFQPWREVVGSFDALIFSDCGDLKRIGEAQAVLPRCRRTINIDHHISNRAYAEINLIDPGAAATGEVVYDLLEDLGVPFDYPIAIALYTAIVTDTGSFMYESTTSRTHRRAARLLDCGVDPALVSQSVWENKPLSSLRLLQRGLANLRVEGDLGWITVGQEDLAAAGAERQAAEGLVNYARMVRGVEVAVLFLEEAPGQVKVSLRSNRWADVSRIAARFGGGGHARAAGVTLSASLGEAEERLLGTAREVLRQGSALAR